MSFISSMNISQNALSAQRLRLDVITQNIAMAEVTRTADGTPYRRQLVVFEEKKAFKDYFVENQRKMTYEGVTVAGVIKDQTDFIPVFDPAHPDANEDGYVMMPNVNKTEETLDLMAAEQSYNANVQAFNAVKYMASKALTIGK